MLIAENNVVSTLIELLLNYVDKPYTDNLSIKKSMLINSIFKFLG